MAANFFPPSTARNVHITLSGTYSWEVPEYDIDGNVTGWTAESGSVPSDAVNAGGTSRNDTLTGDGRVNAFWGSGGSDTLNGGGNDGDHVSYELYGGGVTLNLDTGVATKSGGGTDTLISIEHAHASFQNDTITTRAQGSHVFARSGDDTMYGLGGNDHFIPGSGNDYMDGGGGTNYVEYTDDSSDGMGPIQHGVYVNLLTGTATDGWGGSDTLVNIHGVIGSKLDDVIEGDGQGNGLYGREGNDILKGGGGNDDIHGEADHDDLAGGAGDDSLYGEDGFDFLDGGAGADLLDGGGGIDFAVYAHGGAVVLGLPGSNVASSGDAAGDVLVDIEVILGSASGDRFALGSGATTVYGGGGGDIIEGSSAGDALYGDFGTPLTDPLMLMAAARGHGVGGSAGNDTIYGDLGSDTIYGDGGDDLLYAGRAELVSFLTTDDAPNSLFGGGGNDVLISATLLPNVRDELDGGDGIDHYFVDGKDLIRNFEVGETANYRSTSQAGYVVLHVSAGHTFIDFLASSAPGAANLGTLELGNAVLPGDLSVSNQVLNFVQIQRTADTSDQIRTAAALQIFRQYTDAQVAKVTDYIAKAFIFKGVAKSIGDKAGKIVGDQLLHSSLTTDQIASIEKYFSAGVTSLVSKSAQNISNKKPVEQWITAADVASVFLDILKAVPGLKAYVETIKIGGLLVEALWAGVRAQITIAINELLPLRDVKGAFVLPDGADNFIPDSSTVTAPDGTTFTYVRKGDPSSPQGSDGIDVIYSERRSETLGPKVENGQLVTPGGSAQRAAGTVVQSMTGNSLANQIGGTDKANVLSGRGGSDTLIGNGGNDTLRGDGGADILLPGKGRSLLDGGRGRDEVDYSTQTKKIAVDLKAASAATVKIGGSNADTLRNVEDVKGGTKGDRLGGDGKDNALVGNGGADTLSGVGGKDSLVGGEGKDRLTGGASADHFVFDAALGKSNVDTITDFKHNTDIIALDDAIFSAIGSTLDKAEFYAKSGVEAAHDKSDRIVYDTKSGKLYYDADGKGGAAAVHFATLSTKPVLDHGDFAIV